MLVEYGDYECPYCGAAYPVVTKVERRLEGQLCLRVPSLPDRARRTRTPCARPRRPEAAGAEGQFWPMHDRLFQSPGLTDEMPGSPRRADRSRLDRFVADLSRADTPTASAKTSSSGARSGVNGTPTFFVNGIRHDGPHDASR